MTSCQVCWRITKMAQRSNRGSLNLISEAVIRDRVSYIGRERADSIMARNH